MADTNPNDSDAGKDFSGLVPNMGVSWDSIPSFNDTEPPTTKGGDGASPTEVADSGPILYDADTARATENTLLTQGRHAVADYENLRHAVEAAVHTQFWGPAHPAAPNPEDNIPSLNNNSSNASQVVFDQQVRENQEKLAQAGEKAAAEINPMMQKALALISNSIELVGNYLAMLHASGQAYSNVDRVSRFPGPPGSIKR
ncbi:hypothetical protein [Streptomyces sp. NPDC090080]|uniref:hypothetical protein n=1 Tax=Streptomyces sp. NPDC090080 TaxID=3365939 RepID=UPI00382E2142